MKTIVIGSGVSGLTAAALLAQDGHEVRLYEQNERVGGVTAGLEKDGYRWDYGQLLLGDLGPGEPAWRVLDRLDLTGRVPTVQSYREYSFPDFRIERPPVCPGRWWRKEALARQFPEDRHGLDRYYRLYERIHDLAGLSGRRDPIARIRFLLTALPVARKQRWSAEQLMEHCFSNPKLRAVFTSILADYVARPEDFPGLMIPVINAESQFDERVPLDYGLHPHRSSWRFIIGGCRRLVDALEWRVTACGGSIRTGMAVKRILLEEGRVRGVALADGGQVAADAVVASGGAREVFLGLVGREHLPEDFVARHVENIAVTESVLMVHLGVDYDPSVHQNGAALRYHYLTYDVSGAIERCARGLYHEGRDGFLVHIPSKYSPSMAPPGHHAVTVYTIAPDHPSQGSWEADGERWVEELLDVAERSVPGLRQHERCRVVVTPIQLRQRTHLAASAFGGVVPRLDRTPPAHRTPIEGLWFVGAQSEEFGGVAAGLTGAASTVQMMLGQGRRQRA
jgi:phytoene dehydrogenase-like protein